MINVIVELVSCRYRY